MSVASTIQRYFEPKKQAYSALNRISPPYFGMTQAADFSDIQEIACEVLSSITKVKLSYSTVNSKETRVNPHSKTLAISQEEILKSLWNVLPGAFRSAHLAWSPWQFRHNLVRVTFLLPRDPQRQGTPHILSATLQFKKTAEAKKFQQLLNRERGKIALMTGIYALQPGSRC